MTQNLDGPDKDRLLFVEVGTTKFYVGYQGKPSDLAKRRPGRFAGYWTARLWFPADEPGLAPGTQLVSMQLFKWVVDGEGRLNSREKYEWLTEQVFSRVSAQGATA